MLNNMQHELHGLPQTSPKSKQAVEARRRREAGLTLYIPDSNHQSQARHISEFVAWMNSTFGFDSDPLWVCKFNQKGDQSYHLWLLKEPQHLMLAKLAWT